MTVGEKDMTEETDFSKPSFDGRLHYHKTLGELSNRILTAHFIGDVNNWLRGLDAMYCYTAPFIKKNHSAELDEMITKFKSKFGNIAVKDRMQQAFINGKQVEELRQIQRKLFEYTKHLLLPITEDESQEFDEDFIKDLLRD